MKLLSGTFAMVLIALLSISVIGCGENDDDDDQDDDKQVDVDLSFVGVSWEIDSINGEMFETFFPRQFETGQPEDTEVEQTYTLVSNNWVFETDGSLSGNLVFEISEEYPAPPAHSMTQEVTYTITGMYTAEGNALKITTEDVKLDVEVTLEPEDVWTAQLGENKTLEGLKADLAEASKSGLTPSPSNFIFDSRIEYTWDATEDTLTLTYSVQKMVLKKSDAETQ